MLALVIFFVLSHVFSFFCSIWESVLLSCTPAYVALLKKQKAPAGAILEELKSRIDRPLAAILTLNTISHTIGAAGVGASIVETFGEKWLALGSILLTLTMLYWTEMLPKTVGALYWKTLAPLSARPIQWLIVITYPFVASFNLFGRLLSRKGRGERITEEDIRIALEVGTKAGVIEEAEQEMVENIFRLGDRRVGVLMVPRVDIVWLDLRDGPDEIRRKMLASKHHRFPVCDGDIDKVAGVIHARALLTAALASQPIDLESLMKPPLFVHENLQVFGLMDMFKKAHTNIALVTDEYGSIQGMITIGDVLEAIVKEVDVGAGESAQVVQVSNHTWLLDGGLPIDEFKEIFHFETLPDEERARYRTLSGLCMAQLGAVPRKGNSFSIIHFRFEILKVRHRRVEKVLLTKLS